MAETTTGHLLIADISGYTLFLSQSELEHAQEILSSLLELLIENTKIPLVISRLEGDAVISYAPEGSFIQGSTLIEMVESCYVAFRRALELMVVNTSCTCNACRNIHSLDLKFFIHFGSFALQPLPAYTELVGSEVNLIHRLTKNHVKERTGLQAYALFTRPAIEVLGLAEWAAGMTKLTESYEHIGDVEVYVQDLSSIWEMERERTRITVKPETAIFTSELDFPVAPVYLWDYLLKPDLRAIYLESDTAEARNLRSGRVGQGTVYICAHGRMIHPQTIMDWRPFKTHTILDEPIPGISNLVTYHLYPTKEGTRLVTIVGPANAKNPLIRAVADRVMVILWLVMGKKGIKNLRDKMWADLAAGKALPHEATNIDLNTIRSSIKAALSAEREEPA
jgi:hypothetical protein